MDAISALKPLENDPRNSKSWRIYNVLHQRFVGQWSQRKVALNLALSERQLQREEERDQSADDPFVDNLSGRSNLANRSFAVG